MASLKNLRVCVLVAILANSGLGVSIQTVPVGSPGNPGELSGASVPGGYGSDRIAGSVAYAYSIGKYEITAGQYCEFLNAVAKADTYGLYRPEMAYPQFQLIGCAIQRQGVSGNYSYRVAPEYANRPVNYVSWGSAARFANWMHNGQPTGEQGLATTEDGSYYLNGAVWNEDLLAVTRKPTATWVIPSEDEWYKAAYYDPGKLGGAGYWDYATRSDSAPGRTLADLSGNNANYLPSSGGPYPIDSATYYTTVGGEFESSASPYGTFDQAGNVDEWNETVNQNSYRVVRSGAFDQPSSTMLASVRTGSQPVGISKDRGFRLAYVPEPVSAAFFAVGVLALLVRRPVR